MKIRKTLIALVVAGSALSALGQDSSAPQGPVSSAVAEKTDRKLIYRVDPVYPQDLKRFYIGGTVRLKVLVSARGTVESVAPLGGNPALVDSSVAAVKKWKYTPATSSSEITLNLVFNPHN
jgi:TonB family protein